jgi:hypothetical protein
MCFSSTASFAASAVLSVTGVASMAYARTRAQRVLAGIPLIFAVQQFTEGVLWMALMHPEWAQWETVTTYAFQVFAQMTWPLYIPLCALLFEHSAARRKVIWGLFLSGILLSAFTGYCLYVYPVHAIASKHHIMYESGFPLAKQWYYGLLYFLPTILAPLISSAKALRWLGVLFLVSYVIARLLFHYYEISVWCFFGALISILVLFFIRSLQKPVSYQMQEA